jgi:hypothetical protein
MTAPSVKEDSTDEVFPLWIGAVPFVISFILILVGGYYFLRKKGGVTVKAFILFVVVSLIDMAFTIIGISKGIIAEGNVVIKFISNNLALNIYQSIVYFKLIAIMVAYWFVTYYPVHLNNVNKQITFEVLLEKGTCERILLVMTIITAFFGAIPSFLINLHHTLFFNKPGG